MSIASAVETVTEVLEIAEGAMSLGKTLAQMAIRGEVERIDEILPPRSRTALKKEIKDAEARAKFGPRPPEQG